MTCYFPDINVWIALAIASHPQSQPAWDWLNDKSVDDEIYFSRHTQLGFLRLLSTPNVIAEKAFTLQRAWGLFHEFTSDARVQMLPEPAGLGSISSEYAAPRPTSAPRNSSLTPISLRSQNRADSLW